MAVSIAASLTLVGHDTIRVRIRQSLRRQRLAENRASSNVRCADEFGTTHPEVNLTVPWLSKFAIMALPLCWVSPLAWAS
jgi:hypothetical protein